MLYRDVLGSYTTYGGGSSGRIANIQLACGSCNDVILNPGDIFSYNDTVGERTIERGFQSAPVIVNGQLVPGIGGGICQVSSTLYAACLNAGLEIVERYPRYQRRIRNGRISVLPQFYRCGCLTPSGIV